MKRPRLFQPMYLPILLLPLLSLLILLLHPYHSHGAQYGNRCPNVEGEYPNCEMSFSIGDEYLKQFGIQTPKTITVKRGYYHRQLAYVITTDLATEEPKPIEIIQPLTLPRVTDNTIEGISRVRSWSDCA